MRAKRILTAMLLLSTAVWFPSPCAIYAQQRSIPPDRTIAPAAAGTVTLTRADYDHLVDLAAHQPKPAEPAPVSYAISNAAFNLRLNEDSVTGSANIEGEILRKGPSIVPLLNGMTILEASQAQGPLPLVQQNSIHSAVINGPGRFSVSLKVASGIRVDPGTASFVLPAPPAASTVLTLEMPGNHANINVEPGLVTKRTEANGITTIEATLEPGKPTRVWWTTRDIAAPAVVHEAHFLSDIKTMISVGDSQLRIAALCDVTVVQGEPAAFRIPLPAGYEVTEASGATVDSSETQSGVLVLKVREPARRAHQFLIVLERPEQETKVDIPFLGFEGAQRETGETLVEGAGALELTAKESGGVRRIDVSEAGAIARSLARFPLQAAFRFHRQSGESPALQLEWKQFPESGVVSAVAERATVTSLVNVEGKLLTEVTLRVRNHAQPYVKVELPKGATILSADVDGERVKPVEAADGSRVPLLRAGRSPSACYDVSFVYLNSGAAFAKNGSYELSLPKLDIPVDILTWEVLLPERLEVKQFGGDAFSTSVLAAAAGEGITDYGDAIRDDEATVERGNELAIRSLGPGQIGGTVVDQNGAVIAKATVKVLNVETGAVRTTVTNADGSWAISGVSPGPVRVTVESTGFKSNVQELAFEPSKPVELGTTLQVGSLAELVEVTPGVAPSTLSTNGNRNRSNKSEGKGPASKADEPQQTLPSNNVYNLQRRVSGILPVRVDIPRGGKSYRFVRPLVLNEETKLTFQYKTK